MLGERYMPSSAWKSLLLKMRMTRSIAVRSGLSCGLVRRPWYSSNSSSARCASVTSGTKNKCINDLSTSFTCLRSTISVKTTTSLPLLQPYLSDCSKKLLCKIKLSKNCIRLQNRKFDSIHSMKALKKIYTNQVIEHVHSITIKAIDLSIWQGYPVICSGKYLFFQDFPAGWQIFPEQNRHLVWSEDFRNKNAAKVMFFTPKTVC